MKGLYYPIAQHLQQFCQADEFVIWRDAFRWKRHMPDKPAPYHEWESFDEVLPNHYDSMEVEQLAEEFGYEVDWENNLKHVAIVRKK